MRTASEIKAALAWNYAAHDDDATYVSMAAAKETAEEEVAYAKTLARLGRDPEGLWTEQDDPRLVAWKTVLEKEVRVASAALQGLVDYRVKDGEVDAEAVLLAARRILTLAEKLKKFSQPAPVNGRVQVRRPPTLEDAQRIPQASVMAEIASRPKAAS